LFGVGKACFDTIFVSNDILLTEGQNFFIVNQSSGAGYHITAYGKEAAHKRFGPWDQL
jgi:hypothetical protein